MSLDFSKKRTWTAGSSGQATLVKAAADNADSVGKGSSAVAEESDRKDWDDWSKLANSKIKCLNCDRATLFRYVAQYDSDGDEEISLMDCLNCGFKYSHFDKYEKREKPSDSDSIWWFVLMVLSIVSIIVIRGYGDDQFLNGGSSSRQKETVRSTERVVASTVDEYPVRVLNDAEPFRVAE